MRVLIATWGWRSHFYPLVPLAWALVAAGHRVRVASQPSMVDAITTAGLPAVPVGPDLDFAAVFGGLVGRVAPASGAAGVAPAITPGGGVFRYADAMLDDLVAFGRRFRPDLVVYEPLNLAGAVAAAVLGVPGVRHLWGPDESTRLDLDRDAVLGPLAARHDVKVAEVEPAGALILDPCPAGMQVPLAAPSHPIRFVPYNGVAVVPDWLAERTVPRVCLTAGTTLARLGLDAPMDLPTVARAVAELDVEVVLALEPAQHAGLGDFAPNVRLATAPLSLDLVLPTCQAVVHQGGAGSTMTALVHGVPQLVLPQISDQHFTAERLCAVGGGMALEVAHPGAVRDRVADLLTDARWHRSAGELRRRIASMPTPADLVPVLERLASSGEPP